MEENILGPMAQQVDPERLLVFNRDEDTFLHLCRQHDIRVLHYHYNTYMMHGVRLMGFRVLYTIHNIYTLSLIHLSSYLGVTVTSVAQANLAR